MNAYLNYAEEEQHMNDKPKANKGELIPSLERSLTRKKSGLAKRGLELIHELKKQQVQVVIGNFDDPVNRVFIEVIREVIKNKYYLKVITFIYGEEILEIADKKLVDIFIFVMNNLLHGREGNTFEDSFENSLQLITQVKTTYGKPVIALLSSSTCLEHPSYVTKAKIAADFFFQMPFKLDAFRYAIEKCFDMLPGFDEALEKAQRERET